MEVRSGQAASPSGSRLKREDHDRTKHDSCFAEWQILIGPSDWVDYSSGKEGAARYRVHNLPTSSGPGLYELGIAVSRSGRELGRNDVVVVYLGQADNVRNRLQSYGRSGAHLASSSSCSEDFAKSESFQKGGGGLFEDIFSRGYSIVFRWASMTDKRAAEKTEAQLLETFDYAWNKGCNGARRPSDIHKKLDKVTSTSARYRNIYKTLQLFGPGKVGIKIEASKPHSPQECISPDEDSKNFLPRVFKFNRSYPRIVSDNGGINQGSTDICGFIMNGGPCTKPPVPGRMRCEEHKGKRISALSYVSKNKHDAFLDSCNHNNQGLNPACGVHLGEGAFCIRPAVQGRKRCEEHKGMRVTSYISKLKEDNKIWIPTVSSPFGASNISSEPHTVGRLPFLPFAESSVKNDVAAACGASLVNGSFCRRQPVQGAKRCWQHKGMRVEGSFSGISLFSSIGTPPCGVVLRNGSVCTSAPAPGRKRCERHKGMRVT